MLGCFGALFLFIAFPSCFPSDRLQAVNIQGSAANRSIRQPAVALQYQLKLRKIKQVLGLGRQKCETCAVPLVYAEKPWLACQNMLLATQEKTKHHDKRSEKC